MKKQIIESNTEPNKNCLWLTPNGLKRYGKSGWEDLTNGSGGGEDKVFEIKIKVTQESNGNQHPEFMINDIGWLSSSFGASGVDETGWRIDLLNGEDWKNKGETIREIFKDIESYNKFKLTQFLTLGDMEIPISSTEELTYQLIDTNGMFLILLYSKIYRNRQTGHLLMAQIAPDGTSTMSISLDY